MPPMSARALVLDVVAAYAIPDRLTPPAGTLMPGQDPATGGAAAEPPKDAGRIYAAGAGAGTDGPTIQVFGNATFAEAGVANRSMSASPESPRFSRLRSDSISPERQPPGARRRVQFEVAEAPVADAPPIGNGRKGVGAWGAAMLRGLRKSVTGPGAGAPLGDGLGAPSAGNEALSGSPGVRASAGAGSPANNRYSQAPRPWPLPDLELGAGSPGDGAAVVDDYDRRFTGVAHQARVMVVSTAHSVVYGVQPLRILSVDGLNVEWLWHDYVSC